MNEMGWPCGTYGRKRDTYRILVRRLEGKRPLGRPRRRWGIILKWNLRSGMGEAWLNWSG